MAALAAGVAAAAAVAGYVATRAPAVPVRKWSRYPPPPPRFKAGAANADEEAGGGDTLVVGTAAGNSALLFQVLPKRLVLEVLARLPATSHNHAASVCPIFRSLIKSPQFKRRRRAAGFEEQFLVAAGGIGRSGCGNENQCVVMTRQGWNGWQELPDIPCCWDFGVEGLEGCVAVGVDDTVYLLGGACVGAEP